MRYACLLPGLYAGYSFSLGWRRTTIGDSAFFVAAPRAWITLPSSVAVSETLSTFKRRLKIHLFLPRHSLIFSKLRTSASVLFFDFESVLEVIFRLLNDTLIIFV